MANIRSTDEITQAVLARPEVVRLLGHGQDPGQVRDKVLAYLDELRTTQRYPFYRALQHPLYPILRKVTRHHEHVEIVRDAAANGRVVYASNHRSHLDYLVEPLVLDDSGIRPPLIAAGINLFGGPLGLIHKHVTGAVPIRRATKDPIYLTTLKAYIAERLRDHDLFFYPEGGRSYSGEMKPHKTGILHAVLQSGVANVVLVPVAIAYDLVLEDRAIARQGVKKRQRPFTYELAEMVGLAVGYRSRAFVTFGPPIAVSAYDPDSRKDALDLAHLTRDTIGRLFKVLPTAIVASVMRPSITLADLESQAGAALEQLEAAGANLLVRDAKHVVDDGVSRLEQRGVIQADEDRLRVRDRNVLRYYARSIQHLLPPSPPQ
ncbi:MAG: 1-acyl-sn-glycerol-3-phosphate acyltransferase [Rhodospirillaceae bacterium]